MSAVLHKPPESFSNSWVGNRLGKDEREDTRREFSVVGGTSLRKIVSSRHLFDGIVGDSPALEATLKEAELVAQTDSTVLIQGETGTGKELIAAAIHSLSPRRHNNIIKVNCAAIPAGLLESELFGHERGAFTGANNSRVGRFQLAHKGTLFLDEIGDLPLELQPKLLRILQDQQFEPLGSSRTIQTDVRVITATHCDLAQMVQQGKLRSDLYYRLNVFPIRVPPLREREKDVLRLARHFADKYARRMNKRLEDFAPAVIQALMSYDWPGNVRELQNVIERAVILSVDGVLRPQTPEKKGHAGGFLTCHKTLEEVERQHILDVLIATNWVVGGRTGAAVRLGLNRSTLNFRMRKLNIRRPTHDPRA